MLIRREVLDQIVRGEVDLVFRRWTKPTVRTGGTCTPAAGLLGIDRVDRVADDVDHRRRGAPCRVPRARRTVARTRRPA